MLKLKSPSKLKKTQNNKKLQQTKNKQTNKPSLGFRSERYLIWLQLQFWKTILNFQEVTWIPVLDTNIESQKLKTLKGNESTVLIDGSANIQTPLLCIYKFYISWH